MPHLCLTEAEIQAAVDEVSQHRAFVIDVETTGLDVLTNEVLWVGLASYRCVHLIPIGHPNGLVIEPEHQEDGRGPSPGPRADGKGMKLGPKIKVTVPAVFTPAPKQVRPDIAFRILKPLLWSDRLKIGHNVKFDLLSVSKYYRNEIPPGPYADTAVLAHLLDESRPDYSLKALTARHFLGLAGLNPQRRAAWYPNLGAKVTTSGIEEIARYLAMDVHRTWLFWKSMDRALTPKLRDTFDVDMQVYRVLMHMEQRGVTLDRQLLQELVDYTNESAHQAEIDAWRICGVQFPLSNNNLKRHYLFGTDEGCQGLTPKAFSRKTNTPQVDKAALAVHADNPLVQAFQRFGVLDKRRSFIEDSLIAKMDANDRVHTSFNLHRAETGRMSSSGPNLQQVPRPEDKAPPRTQIREAFVASPGHTLVVADYDQIELRCIAYLSKDPEMIRLFKNEEDIHTAAAAAIFNLRPEDVSKDQRQMGKTLNFSVGYGATEKRVSKAIGVSLEDAAKFIKLYYRRFSALPEWKGNLLTQAIARGDRSDPLTFPPYVEIPPFGRRRRIPELFSDDQYERWSGQRQAINAVVQGFASYVMKLAMIDLFEAIPPNVYMLLAVHDEIMLEVPNDMVDEVLQLVVNKMESVRLHDKPVLGPVPLIASAGVGPNWKDAK